MKTRTVSKKKNNNLGMRTKSWGPPAWFFLDVVTFGYPIKPTDAQKKQYKQFFTSLKNILPCGLCRESYSKFIKELPLTEKVLKTRKNLTTWFFKIHNKVNKKLGCKEMNLKQMKDKMNFYESFRASKCTKKMEGCTKAYNQKKVPKRTKIITIDDYSALERSNKI